MPVAQVFRAVCFEDAGVTFLARIKGNDGSNITQASLSSIAYTVTDMADASTVISGTLTISAVVFDALQTGARWTVDSTGYNFLWAAPATLAPTGGRKYRVELLFTPASGAVFVLPFEVDCIPILRS